MRAIFWKELADHFGRRRFVLLLGLVVVGTMWGLFIDMDVVVRSGDGFFFLDIFTTTNGVLFSLLVFLSFFGPLIGIALGFDAINSERIQGTLARVLSQPVYRDAFFNGKFLAGLLTLTLVVSCMMIGVVGLAMFRIGIAPSGEEVIRLVGFGLITVAYVAFWLALAMTASVFLRSAVSSALVSIGMWIGVGFLIVIAATEIADALVREVETTEQALRHFNIQLWVSRVSPSNLFSEATGVLLDPVGGRVLTPFTVSPERFEGLLATPVSAAQSLQVIWPHIVVLVAMVAVLLGASYTKFMREEIRA